jgi:hypothetical protein
MEPFMTKYIPLIGGISLLLALAGTASAADHLFTATAAGGLTPSSQPFQNNLNNPGRFNDDVPGQGSPLSGGESITPASDTAQAKGVVATTPKPVTDGKTAPSANSVH